MAIRRIEDVGELALLSKFNGMTKKTEDARLCPVHRAEVQLNYEQTPDTGLGMSAPPIAVFRGCCEEAINRELQFINKTLSIRQ